MADSQIRITADTLQAQAAIKGLTDRLAAVEGSARRSSDSMKGLSDSANTATRAMTALAGAISIGQLVQFADAATNINNKLRSVTANSTEAAAAFKDIGRIAQGSGQNLEAVADLYQKIGLQARDLGLTQKEVGRITENFSKALAVSGTTGAAAASAIYQFGQALGRTKVAYEDIRQLQESSSNTLRLISQQFGMSSSEFIAAVQAGKISSEQLALAVNSLGSELDKVKLDRTIGQSIENIRTSFILLINNFEKSTGAFNAVAQGLDVIAKNIDTVVIAGSVFFTVFAAKKVLDIATAFTTLNSVMGKNPILKLALLAAGAAAAIYEMVDANEAVSKTQDEILDKEAQIKGVTDARAVTGDKLLKQQSLELENYFRKLDAETRTIGLTGTELAIKKNLIAAAEQLKTTESQLHPSIVARITARTREIEVSKIMQALNTEMNTAIMESVRLNIQDLAQREQQLAVDQARLKYGRDLTAEMESQIRATVAQTQANREALAVDEARRKLAGTQTGVEAINRGVGVRQRLNPDSTLQTQFQMDQEALRAHHTRNLSSEAEYQQDLLALKQEYAQKSNELYIQQQQNERNQRQVSIQAEQQRLGKTAEQAQAYAEFSMKTDAEKAQFGIQNAAAMFSAIGQQNKKAFEAAKAFNIANAIMNTYLGVTKSLAMYPFPFNLVAAGASLAMGLAQVAQIRSQSYSGRQLGGPVMSGKTYMVGENGPEMFTPTTNGSITRNGDLGGGQPVQVTFNIAANDTAGFDELLIKRKGMIRQVINDALLESGQRGI